MSQSQRPKGPQGGPQGGSVRRARELLEAGIQPLTQSSAQSPPRPRTGDAERGPGGASSVRPRQPMPAALSASRNGGQSIGTTISRPTQVPQWPLAVPVQSSLGPGDAAEPQSGRGPAPQRPPRPSKSKIPSMLDASKLQDHTPTFQYTPQQLGSQYGAEAAAAAENLKSPNVKSPLTPASRASTLSSAGSIPDFPMPVPAGSDQAGPSGIARKSANLGPPPTARRGASSYYSNVSIVSPIPEESPRTQKTHESYASSSAMPTTWRDDASEDFLDDDESGDRNLFGVDPIPEEGRDSRGSNGDDSSERGLVRSASIGRRGKPSVVTTRSFEKTSPPSTSPPLGSEKLAKMGVFGPMEMRAAQMKAAAVAHANAPGGRPSPTPVQGEQRETIWPMMGTTESPLAGGTGLIENSSSESTSTLGRATTPKTEDTKAFHPPGLDRRMSKILHAHQAASGVQATDEKELERSISRLSAVRRPPKLDLNSVKEAESRGSLTSLPDLIRRATKLAAMIDKGKRPGSRLNNLNDFSDSDAAREKEEGAPQGRRPLSGLSGMLAAFPPPGLATPREHSPRPQASWPNQGPSPNALDYQAPPGPKPSRRCCGLPIWVFLLITLITVLIVAAAVLVPLFLLVINKPANTSNATSQIAQCQQNMPCANGGTSVISSNICSCICVNGFTGSTCAFVSATGCTTTTITSSNGTEYQNVTLGESIPRLISSAKANFSISLSSDIILARFSSANLSCDAENALVTFNGMDWPVGSVSSPASASGGAAVTPTARAVRVRRDVTFSSTAYETTASVNPSIIFDTSAPPMAPTNPTTTPAVASPTTIGAVPSPSPSHYAAGTAPFTLTQESLDFARVAVLFILQRQNMNNAVLAQSDIQSFFNTALTRGLVNSQAANITAGMGNSIDFWRLNLVLNAVEKVGRS